MPTEEANICGTLFFLIFECLYCCMMAFQADLQKDNFLHNQDLSHDMLCYPRKARKLQQNANLQSNSVTYFLKPVFL